MDRLAVRVMLAARAGMPRAHPERARLGVAVRDEALLDRPRDGRAEHPLDAPEQVRLVDADQADRFARRAGTAASPEDGVSSPTCSPNCRSSRARSNVDAYRYGGSFARHRFTTHFTCAGTVAGSEGASSSMIAAIVCAELARSNARRRASIS
jgi:hypothetical protein